MFPRLFQTVVAMLLLTSALPAAVQGPSGPADARTRSQSFWDQLHLGTLWTDNGILNWLMLFVWIFAGVLAGRMLSAAMSKVGWKLQDRGWEARAHFFDSAAEPVKLGAIAIGLALGLGQMRMAEPPDDYLRHFSSKVCGLMFYVAAFWYAFNLVSIIELSLERMARKTQSQLDDQLVPVIRKALRIFVVVAGVLTVVSSIFEKDIGAWLAGLGIAGLAVSLAAQDSLRNLLGSLTILFDKPFHVGDSLKYKDLEGTVEDIGFRSTKVRTVGGTLVTVPNSNIVNDPVENLSSKPSFRRVLNVAIACDTPRQKVEQAVQIIRGLLAEPGLAEPLQPSTPRVYFNDFKADSLNIQAIYLWSGGFPLDYWAYQEHTQRFNLRLMEELEKAGIQFAFPTQTLYLAGDAHRPLAVKTQS